MAAIDGSILALKILVSTKIRDFLNNMDNKSIKNQRKEVSSSHPPRSLSDKMSCKNPAADCQPKRPPVPYLAASL